MHDAVRAELATADVLVMAAAPADFRPDEAAAGEDQEGDAPRRHCPRRDTGDILATTRDARMKGAVVVGFALETDDVMKHAREKLAAKALDLIVVNDAREEGAGFGGDTNRVTILSPTAEPEELAAAEQGRRRRRHPRPRRRDPEWTLGTGCAQYLGAAARTRRERVRARRDVGGRALRRSAPRFGAAPPKPAARPRRVSRGLSAATGERRCARCGRRWREPLPRCRRRAGESSSRREPAPPASGRYEMPKDRPASECRPRRHGGSSSGTASTELGGGPLAHLDSIDAVAQAVASCTACALHAGAKNPVPGEGNPHAGFVCVGEAPGATEDETGRPFVGAAGQLLTKILEAVKFRREDVFICNVLKHRPPGNRNPAPDEIKACSPYLLRQLELLQPRVILALGTFAAQTLLQTTQPIGKLRGQVHRYYGVPLIVTYHPAALLRNPIVEAPHLGRCPARPSSFR